MVRILLIALSASILFPISGCSYNKKTSINHLPVIETLVKAKESWNGDPYSYPLGEAELTLLKMTVPVGFRTPVHTHLQPGIAYVAEGKLECVVKADKTAIFSAGEAFATTFGETPHYCESVGEKDSLVFVTYAGVEGQQLTIPYK